MRKGGNINTKTIFQLTTSRRGRQPFSLNRLLLEPFNSRPHEEVDVNNLYYRMYDVILSTHDLTKRSTILSEISSSLCIFQLTTSRRGRRYTPVPTLRAHVLSTHDLTKRSTYAQSFALLDNVPFNSRPHEEVDFPKK